MVSEEIIDMLDTIIMVSKESDLRFCIKELEEVLIKRHEFNKMVKPDMRDWDNPRVSLKELERVSR